MCARLLCMHPPGKDGYAGPPLPSAQENVQMKKSYYDIVAKIDIWAGATDNGEPSRRAHLTRRRTDEPESEGVAAAGHGAASEP
jgi:hypothetical protein